MSAWITPRQWVALVSDVASLSAEAQQVIGLRFTKFATQPGSQREMVRMMIEKPAAFAAAQIGATLALAHGHRSHVAAGRALGVFRRKVRANRKRLRKG